MNDAVPAVAKPRRSRLVAMLVTVLAAAGVVAVSPAAQQAAYADTAAAGGDYIALATEGHLLDTRYAIGVTTKTPVAAGSYVSFPVLGKGGVPASGVSGVVVDITAVNPTTTTSSWLWIGPSNATAAGSNVNIKSGSGPISNSAVSAIGSDGKLKIYNSSGTTHVVVDVQGYYTDNTAASGPGGFVAVNPIRRIVDTRDGTGLPKAASIAAGGSLTVDMSVGGAIPSGSPSAYFDAIVTGATAGGYLAEYPVGGNAAAATSVFDFLAGTTASGATAKLGTNNGVVFVNHSSAAIHLVIQAEGYTSPTAGAGAGYRPALKRVAGLAIAASGTATVQVVGQGGVPTHGVAAVAANLTVSPGTGAGYLKPYSSDGTPGASAANFPASSTRADLVFLRPGPDGKIKVYNSSSTAITLYVDLQGYYVDGNSTAVPVATYSPVSILQPLLGSGNVEGAYVRNNGALFHGVAGPDTLDSATWTSVPSNLEAFSGQPSMVTLPGGKLWVGLLHARDGEVWTFQVGTTTNLATPVAWTPAYTHTSGIMVAPPTAATFNDGSAAMFGVDAGGQLWALSSAATGYWQPAGSNAGLVGAVSVVTNPSANTLVVVGRTAAGTVQTASYNTAGVLSGWTDLGGTGVADKPAVLETYGPQLRVVVRQGDGGLVTKLQNLNGSWPAAWSPIAAEVGQSFTGAPALGVDSASGSSSDPGTGKQFVLARSAIDNRLYQSDETAESSGVFGPFGLANGQSNPASTDPVVAAFGGSGNNFHWIAAYLDSTASPKLIHQ